MHIVRWRSEGGTGLERLFIENGSNGIKAEGLVIGDRGSQNYGLRYTVCCDTNWVVREVSLDVQGGGNLRLFSDGNGNWENGEGVALAELAGCIDVDISATPFTNTLPIRRLKLSEGQREAIRVVYIPVPSLVPAAAEQAYTCLVQNERYRYEGIFRNFETDLEVDPEGIVLDYPSLFTRVET
jgi:hypothetical protein